MREIRFNYTEEYGRLIFTNGRRITLLPGKMGKIRGLPEKRKKIIRIFYIKYLDLNVYSTFGVHRLLALKNVVFCDAIYASRTS